jgi:hypothetical protein
MICQYYRLEYNSNQPGSRQMSQESSQKEVAREMLRSIVCDEIDKKKKQNWFVVGGISLVVAFSVSALTALAYSSNNSQTQQVVTRADARNYPLERLVGLTNALMVMADDQIDDREIDFAYAILGKRQNGQLGAHPQFVNDDSAWLDGHMTTHYFEHALFYLKTGKVEYLKALHDNKPAFILESIEDKKFNSYSSEKRAVYELISIIQDDLASDIAANRKGQVNDLAQLWVDLFNNVQMQDAEMKSGIYSARKETILSTLR